MGSWQGRTGRAGRCEEGGGGGGWYHRKRRNGKLLFFLDRVTAKKCERCLGGTWRSTWQYMVASGTAGSFVGDENTNASNPPKKIRERSRGGLGEGCEEKTRRAGGEGAGGYHRTRPRKNEIRERSRGWLGEGCEEKIRRAGGEGASGYRRTRPRKIKLASAPAKRIGIGKEGKIARAGGSGRGGGGIRYHRKGRSGRLLFFLERENAKKRRLLPWGTWGYLAKYFVAAGAAGSFAGDQETIREKLSCCQCYGTYHFS